MLTLTEGRAPPLAVFEWVVAQTSIQVPESEANPRAGSSSNPKQYMKIIVQD
jgi:hypothetical protein